MASRIEDYGLIGDTKTAALVSKTGSIDWFCPPDFDSDACFAALLGYDEHGRWSIRPAARIRKITQRYAENSLVLITDFECDGGSARLTDFMPLDADRTDIVRILEGIEGSVPFEMVLTARFGFGANAPWIVPNGVQTVLTTGPDALCFRGVATKQVEKNLVANINVDKGTKLELQLSWFESHLQPPAALDVSAAHKRTLDFWKQWTGQIKYEGPYHDTMVRSLITLKALTYSPTGAVVAAPTAGLPEEIGGSRNWDYRFCWLRDASLTLRALLLSGLSKEAHEFRNWLMRAIAGAPEDMQIMYDVHAGRRLTEFELPWLPGYEASRPVRIGNAASEQFQLDIFGEVADTLYHARRMGIPEAENAGEMARALVSHITKVWQREDDGIWEVRGGRKHFTHSKLMAWVAVDRLIKIVEEFKPKAGGQEFLPGLRALRERIFEEVCERGYNPRIGAFTQFYGGEVLDAAMLLVPHMGFLPASDPRVRGTVAAVEKGLLRDGFVMRYATEHGVDGLAGTEGAFLACSFWLADNYLYAGRKQEGEELLSRLVGLQNHLGLWAEEYEPRLQRQIGNFPQGFSHLAFVNTVHVLQETSQGAQRMAAE
jgi:GH15 family glucan-1,4-alpha-glucosidase